MASMVPNNKPILSACESLGLSSVAPLPMAAANASVDIAKAMKSRVIRFMSNYPVGLIESTMIHTPNLRHGTSLVSPTERCSYHGMWPNMLIRTLLVEAGYSPKRVQYNNYPERSQMFDS